MTTTTETPKVFKAKDFQQPHANDWCPGCGDFGILNSMHQACSKLGRSPHDVVVVGGIGCSSKAPYYFGTYGVHTLHGRPIPFGTGMKLANPNLTVLITGGDGDGLGIGAGHFVNAGRRNVDMTYVMFNNEVYGLTKGQAAPTLAMGAQTKSLAEPNMQMKLNPLVMALASGFTWIGRGYSYNVKQLVDLMSQAIAHPGLSFLDVLQPCPTYNDLHTKDWFSGKDLPEPQMRPRPLPEGYDAVIPEGADEAAVFDKMHEFNKMAHEWGDYIPTGVFLENRAISSFEQRIAVRALRYPGQNPANLPVEIDGGPRADLTSIFEELSVG